MKRSLRFLISLCAGTLVQPTLLPTACGSDCYTDCVNSHDCRTSHPWAGSSCYDLCRSYCREDGWGAIAYSSKDKVWGSTQFQDYKATAERIAMQSCAKHGGAKCILQTSFYNTCGAIAADGDLVAWGTDGARSGAQQRALAECARIGGRKCAVQASVCSGPKSTSESGPASPPPPPKTISWGAIAYSTADMGAGWSQGKSDRATAEKEAMNVCSQRGKTCVLRTAFNKQCGALAADRDSTGWGTSANAREAQQIAIAECQRAGGTRCVLHISFCSF